MKRIVHICTDFFPSTGGIEQFVLSLAKRTESIGYVSHVVCLDRIKNSSERLPPKEVVEGISVTRVPFINLRYYKFPIGLQLHHIDADIFHIHGIGGLLDWASWTKRTHKTPIVLSTHGGIFHTPKYRLLKQLYFNQVSARSLRSVDAIIACSHNDSAIFKPITSRLQTVENAVELSGSDALDDCEPHRVLFVGRLANNKRVDLLLNAFARAIEMDQRLRLRIAGPECDGLLAALQRQANKLKIDHAVDFLGAVSDERLQYEYRSAGIFVSASEFEGFGMSLLEALSHGCIPVVQPNAAFKSILGHSSNWLVDFTDAELAGRQIADLARNHGDAMRHELKAISRQYSWDKKILEWQSVYQDVRPKHCELVS